MTSISLSQAGEASSLQLLPDTKDTKMKPYQRGKERTCALKKQVPGWPLPYVPFVERNNTLCARQNPQQIVTGALLTKNEVRSCGNSKAVSYSPIERKKERLVGTRVVLRGERAPWSSVCRGHSFSSRRKAEFPVDCIVFKSMIKERRVEKVCWFIWLYSEQLFIHNLEHDGCYSSTLVLWTLVGISGLGGTLAE